MTSSILDHSDRQKALDPTHSYIVQAPAGSGKTELLTQRFLKLLTCVNEPESIVALTFTQKAAAEMQERILSSLENVANNKKNNQPQTDILAAEVLKHDAAREWRLLQSPHRLRVQTIDSLCAELVSKMPLLSKGIPYVSIEKDSRPYYQEAAERCLIEGINDPLYQSSIEVLLMHRGNHYVEVIGLLADMLNWREQWLPLIGYTGSLSLSKCKHILESALKNLHNDAVIQLESLFSAEIKKELKELCDFTDENLSLQELTPHENNFWGKAINLLLTKQDTWRTQINKTMGFPSETKNLEEKTYFKTMKQRLENILSHYRENTQSETYRLALENYRRLPPTTYSNEQWKILEALITLLPLLAAQLKIVFMEEGKADFSEISEQASEALGSLSEPTDLALYCDYAIKHLLIDEFQDTSFKQFRLLEKLTAGWEPGDGRTLFIVGDPMQSIYRFREAEVSLFLRAREVGIGSVPLESLTLTSNFRSHPIIIEWVNRCFKNIFPAKDDLHLGGVKYHSSEPGRRNYASEGSILYYRNETPALQSQSIVDIIKKIPPDETIGLLVHSRKQLKNIIPYLQQAKIIFQGVDIDLLSARTYIQDLCALTQTLLEPANQLAWYAVLRAPWCGLTLTDLWALTQNSSSFSLSPDGHKRFQEVEFVINQARQQRQKSSLSLWVESTWRALGGHLYTNAEMQEDIETFWSLLDDYHYEQFNLMEELQKKVSNLYSNLPKESNLHIMTIHKSKGLEFDHVILPHLEALSSSTDSPLLQHMERKTLQGDANFLLAASKSVEVLDDPTYQYLKYIDNKKESFERQRLLYVALTRARSHLHLTSVLPIDIKSPAKSSFLYALMPHLPPAICQNINRNNLETKRSTVSTLKRLPECYFNNILGEPSHLKSAEKGNIYSQQLSFRRGASEGGEGAYTKYMTEADAARKKTANASKNWSSSQNILDTSSLSLQQIMGTFIHEQIQHCAENNLVSPLLEQDRQYQHRLIELGVFNLADQEHILAFTRKALKNLQQDARGRWILDSRHQHAQNEYAINYLDKNTQTIQTAILDRTFLDITTNTRWIIDYKTSEEEFLPPGSVTVEFAPQHYREQLKHYGKLLREHLKEKENSPIRLGLYYPITQTWIEWALNEL